MKIEVWCEVLSTTLNHKIKVQMKVGNILEEKDRGVKEIKKEYT